MENLAPTLIWIFVAVLTLVTLKMSVQIVPQSDNWVIESFGKYSRTLQAGFHIIIPFYETVRYRIRILETQLPDDWIDAITHDNVPIQLKLAILYRIIEPSKAIYRIENLELAIKTIVNGTVRSVIGKTDLDGVQSNRRHLADEIENELNTVANEWGIKLTRVEVTDVNVDDDTKDAMAKQLNAERERRSVVTRAEGEKQSVQLNADAELYSAQKKAEAKKILADAEAYAVQVVSKAIAQGGQSAVEFEIKKIQANAVQELAKGNNSKLIMLPSDVLSSLSGTLGKIVDRL